MLAPITQTVIFEQSRVATLEEAIVTGQQQLESANLALVTALAEATTQDTIEVGDYVKPYSDNTGRLHIVTITQQGANAVSSHSIGTDASE